MILQFDVSPDLETRLRHEADRRGLSPDAVTLQLLEEHLPAADRRAQTLALLQSWIEVDDTEAADADYDLFEALDQARTSDRKLFPEDLKGLSW